MGGSESGYERRLPDAVKDLQVPRRDWEVCMTIPENQWGLSQRLVAELCEKNCREYRVHRTCRIHGENMAVNFGPQADGDFRPEEKMLLRELGEWTEKYGKCIQG